MDRIDPFFMPRPPATSGSLSDLNVQSAVDPVNMQFQSGIAGSSLMDSSLGISGVSATAGPPVETAKRKRGRPRKYGPDGRVTAPLCSPKRPRGSSPPAGKKHMSSLGEWLSGSAGIGFTPHVIAAAAGEDISSKIVAFSQQAPRCTCVLSANGTVSRVTLTQPSVSGHAGSITYDGRFEILCLSGSYLLTNNGNAMSFTGGLSVSLSSPDGQILGGGVGGMLIAGGPVQVILGSFVWGGSRTKKKSESSMESDHNLAATSMIQGTVTPGSFLPHSSSVPQIPGDMRHGGVDMYLLPR